jgi:hypothetical protein
MNSRVVVAELAGCPMSRAEVARSLRFFHALVGISVELRIRIGGDIWFQFVILRK